MNAWYSSLANLFVTLYLLLLKIPKYLISDLPKHSTCSFNCKVSSRVKPKYWKDLTLLIVISLVTISSICFGIGLFVAWNSIKLVLSQFIVNLFLTHHKYNSLNFEAKSKGTKPNDRIHRYGASIFGDIIITINVSKSINKEKQVFWRLQYIARFDVPSVLIASRTGFLQFLL